MTIYNVSTARVVFANKLLNLSGGIVGLYFFVRCEVNIDPAGPRHVLLAPCIRLHYLLYGHVGQCLPHHDDAEGT